jgi:predicted ATP-grasp superfamily ATP-dependent carboligase
MSRVAKRVLVTDGEERSALAACRGLRRAGYEVTVLAGRHPAPSHWSRSCSRRVLGPGASVDVRAFKDALEQLLSGHSHDVLVPGSDAALLAISESRDRFEPYVRVGFPPHGAVEQSVDKRLLPSAARAVGLDAPATVCCESPAEGVTAALSIGFPVVVKPARSVVHSNGALRVRGASVANDVESLQTAVARVGAPFLVQRLEHGGTTSSFAGVIAERGLLAWVFSSYRRTWPPDAGAASFSETVFASADLVERVEAMVSSLGWQGIFEVEFLLLPTGRLEAIDFNPRVYGSLALALAADVNMPAIWCDWLLERRARVACARPGVAYRREDTELRGVAAALRRRSLRTAVEIARPQRSVAHAYFKLDDPLPLAARAIALARTWARRRVERGRNDLDL